MDCSGEEEEGFIDLKKSRTIPKKLLKTESREEIVKYENQTYIFGTIIS